MEICTRAISFWTYQTSQEAKYQEMSQKTLEDKLGHLERQLQRMTREVNVELNGKLLFLFLFFFLAQWFVLKF